MTSFTVTVKVVTVMVVFSAFSVLVEIIPIFRSFVIQLLMYSFLQAWMYVFLH